jgi:hypothetical protein
MPNPDQNFHFDADPDPNLDLDLRPSFTHNGKSEKNWTFVHSIFFVSVIVVINFKILSSISKFSSKSLVPYSLALHLVKMQNKPSPFLYLSISMFILTD